MPFHGILASFLFKVHCVIENGVHFSMQNMNLKSNPFSLSWKRAMCDVHRQLKTNSLHVQQFSRTDLCPTRSQSFIDEDLHTVLFLLS